MAPNNKPRVTVLMPVYNGGSFLREAIDSILAQNYRDFELLIIDDGSSDGSAAVVESYSDQRIRFIRNGKNLGLVNTLNKGLDLARGEYVARMDQDDISLPLRLEKQVACLDANADIGVCGTNIEVFGIGNYIQEYPGAPDEVKSSLFFYNALAHPTVIMRKSLLDKYGLRYSPDFVHAEDYDLWQRCSHAFLVVNLPEVLLRYRTAMTSYCRVHSDEQQQTLRKMDGRAMMALGMNPPDFFFEIKRTIRDQTYGSNKDYIVQLKSWINAVAAGNRANGIYPEPSFSRLLSEYWYACCTNSPLGMWAWVQSRDINISREAAGHASGELFCRCLEKSLKNLYHRVKDWFAAC